MTEPLCWPRGHSATHASPSLAVAAHSCTHLPCAYSACWGRSLLSLSVCVVMWVLSPVAAAASLAGPLPHQAEPSPRPFPVPQARPPASRCLITPLAVCARPPRCVKHYVSLAERYGEEKGFVIMGYCCPGPHIEEGGRAQAGQPVPHCLTYMFMQHWLVCHQSK